MALDDTPVWEQLGTAALLGTERAGELPPLDGPLAAATRASGREAQLLAAAAAVDVYRRAGTVATAFEGAITPAPVDRLSAVSRKADADLQTMLGGTYDEALPEWLAACAAAGKRVRDRSLPALLDLSVKKKELRELVAPVLGERGRWLAAQRPDWRRAFDTPGPDTWDTGTKEERLTYLRQVRKNDPAAARALLEGGWSQAGPDERAKCVEVLAEGLSMADEPFLEAALDDKRKEVREAAADLLARLPQSRLAHRMLARLAGLVSVQKKAAGKAKLDVDVPDAHTPDLARDGIGPTTTVYGLGDKAFWLSQIIAAAPVTFWTDTLKMDVPALTVALKKNEWAHAVFRGLAEAAGRQCGHPVARALLAEWAWKLKDLDEQAFDQTVERLMRALPPGEREAALAPYLSGADDFLERDVLLTMVRGCGHPWTRTFSDKFTRLLTFYVTHERGSWAALREVEATFGYRVSPDIAPALVAKAQADPTLKSRHLDTFLAIVQFRHDMLKELSS